MKNKPYFLLVASLAGMAIAMLWWRVRQLEDSVESLNLQLKAKPEAVFIERANTRRTPTKAKQHFYLIDSPAGEENKTGIGVPWDVERAMMGDAMQNKAPTREKPSYDAENSPKLLEKLNSPRREEQPNKLLNDGGFN